MRSLIKKLLSAVKRRPALYIVRLPLCLAVLAVLAAAVRTGDGNRAFYCLLTLACFFAPEAARRVIKLDLPDSMSIIFNVMLFCANILGELIELYLAFPLWDSLLHLVSGFALAVGGYAIIEVLNGETVLKPAFAAVFALCFAITVSVAWEFFEYFMDNAFHTDMQKDAYITSISSVLLNPQGHNVAVTEVIESVAVNGRDWPGYIDIGLRDTMQDLLLAAAGSLAASVCVFFHERSGRAWRFIEALRTRKAE